MTFSQGIRLLVCVLLLCISLPFFTTFQIFLFIYRYFSKENVNGKVILVTGASSGIGEKLSYEYAKRGASLFIVARREKLLKKVAEKARKLGAADVVLKCADVSNIDDCKRVVEDAVNYFGRLDHLVNNAGIFSTCPIEDVTDFTKFKPVMDVNFWGSVYTTHFAIPHLKRTKGKIFVNASASTFLPVPGVSIYGASKAALVGFYETLRVEIPPEITITIATLGFVDSEITQGKYLTRDGITKAEKQKVQDNVHKLPVMDSDACAKAIVDGVCRKQRYVTEPKWLLILWALKCLCPELMEWAIRIADISPTKPIITRERRGDK